MTIKFLLWIISFINIRWHFMFCWKLFAWNKTFSEFNVATLCYIVLHLPEKSTHSFISHHFFFFFTIFLYVYFLEHRVRFEFVAHLENIFILIRQLSSYLFHDLFICFYICHLFYASHFYASLLFLFYLQLNGKCFISFFILQWFGKFVQF